MKKLKPKKGASSIRIAVDIGGTFTDGLALITPGDRIWVSKTLTTPHDFGEAVTTVMTDLLRQVHSASPAAHPVVSEFVHGTTLVTNALIERAGARTALIVTQGTRDVLTISREVRYDLYDLNIELPVPLVPDGQRLEVRERLNVHGETIIPLADTELNRLLDDLARLEIEAVAICLLHSYVRGDHEQAIQNAIKHRFPQLAVCISSGIAREIREWERMSTVVANAYVQPMMAEYLRRLHERITDIAADIPIRIMVSSGGFTSASAAAQTPILLLESGPAGGVVSALNTARHHAVHNVLAFDMGGTTAKACVAVGGEPLVTHSFECARVSRFKRGSGLPILIPSIDLIEIGAGGGSVAHINQLGLLNVGPKSSGAVPGPACYGRGGTAPTVTDADLLLGYLNPKNFLGGHMRLRTDLAQQAMQHLATPLSMSAIDVAWGICNIVNENMAAAARIHIAEKGYDPRTFTIVATGGAGPVHAVEVARKLHIATVLAGIAAGAGSCLGLLAAPARADRSWSHPTLVNEIVWRKVREVFATLRRDAEHELVSAGASKASVTWSIGAEMRYAGQGHNVSIALPWRTVSSTLAGPLVEQFERRYKQSYGHLVPGGLPQVFTWRLTGRSSATGHRFSWGDARTSTPAVRAERAIYLPVRGAFGRVPVFDRYSLQPGTELAGPVILEEHESTLVVPVVADVRVLSDRTVSVTIREFA